MKQTKFYIIIAIIGLLTSIFFFNSCQKEDDNLQSQPNLTLKSGEFSYKLTTTVSYSNIQLVNGLLAFKDMRTFKTTLNSLERQAAEWDDAFVQRYALSDKDKFSEKDIEELNNKEEEIGFNDKQPLINFEKHFGFNSLRKKTASEEEDWLNHEELNLKNCPDNVITDVTYEEEQTLLNENAEVMIGKSIYKLTDKGYFKITDGNFNTLYKLRNKTKNYKTSPNVIFIGNDDDGCGCKSSDACSSSNRSNSGFKNSGDKRIKHVLSYWKNPWDARRIMAKTKNYKKNKHWWGTTWKKYSTWCKAKPYGYISGSSNDCSTKVNFNPNNYYKTSTSKKVKCSIYVQNKIKSGWVKGYHYGAGGITYTSTLKW